MIVVALPIYLVARWCTVRSGFAILDTRQMAWGWRLTALLMVVTGLLATRQDGRWPFDHDRASDYLLLGGERPAASPEFLQTLAPLVPAAVEEAAGDRKDLYKIRTSGRRTDIEVVSDSRESGNAGKHIDRFFERLLTSLPSEFASGSRNPTSQVGRNQRLRWRSVSHGLIPYGLLAAIAATCCALLGGAAGVCGICAMCGAFAAMVFVPTPPYPFGSTQLAPKEPLPAIERAPLELDFSTPEAAARSLFKAATRRDQEAVLQCFAKTQWNGKKPGPGYPHNIATIPGGRVTKITRTSRPALEGKIELDIELDSYRGTRRVTYGFLLEKGEWKLTSE